MRTFSKKVVLITGAGSGLGRALALEVASHGATPVLTDISEAGLAETADLLTKAGGRSSRHALDVRSPAAWSTVISEVVALHGGLDVLINNAGVFSRAESILDVSTEHSQFVMDVNFWGVFHGTRAAIPFLAMRPEGHIVNTSSAMALIGSPMHSVYAASKAAVANFTAVLRQELRGTRIGVTTVFPGATQTGLGRNVQADSEEQRQTNAKNFERFPLNQPGKVARAIIRGILGNKPNVVTGFDGHAMNVIQRLAPEAGYRLVNSFYRRVSDPAMFESLDKLRSLS